MYCQNLTECYGQISAYADGATTGYPLIINVENYNDYQEIMGRLGADGTKRCIHVSEHTFKNGLPNIQETIGIVRARGEYVLSGLSQSLMLRGESALDKQLDEFMGLSIQGHLIVVLSHCRVYLERYLKRDLRLHNRLIFVAGDTSKLPQICLAASNTECVGDYDDGMQALQAHLERITDKEIAHKSTIYVVTLFSASFFHDSMYAISVSDGIYDVIAKLFTDLGDATEKADGTDAQWGWMYERAKKYYQFAAFINDEFGSTTDLIARLEETLDGCDENRKWLLWIALRMYGAGTNAYLTYALTRSDRYDNLSHHIYQDLLDVSRNDERFETFYKERKQLLTHLPENLPEVSTYCSNVGRHGKNAVYYLTDTTEDEEYTFMQIVDRNVWSDEELYSAVDHAFPELSLYLREFVFDSMNTRLSDKDASFRDTLTKYFCSYKLQKVKNHIDDVFLEQVNAFAVERPFYKLQPRSSIVMTMNKKGVQAYFFDALGVEYLAYIQAKCEEYGLIFNVQIAHCELPSITVKNKEFKKYLDTKDIGDLDELKHHSQMYDYEKCKYPIHIFRELEIIDRELRRIRSQLIQNSADKAVILSDHGASRLAVIYKHENGSMLQLDEKGEHSGRCCPCDTDPEIAQAAYEDGYAVLANYERFKGSRKANLEVHGGATLEETVVPIITVSLKPDKIVYCFVDQVIRFKVGKPTVITLFSNVPMKEPVLEVEGMFYKGAFTTDKNHAEFVLTEQKRVREYKATVYEGNTSTGVELTFRIERGTKTRDLFG